MGSGQQSRRARAGRRLCAVRRSSARRAVGCLTDCARPRSMASNSSKARGHRRAMRFRSRVHARTLAALLRAGLHVRGRHPLAAAGVPRRRARQPPHSAYTVSIRTGFAPSPLFERLHARQPSTESGRCAVALLAAEYPVRFAERLALHLASLADHLAAAQAAAEDGKVRPHPHHHPRTHTLPSPPATLVLPAFGLQPLCVPSCDRRQWAYDAHVIFAGRCCSVAPCPSSMPETGAATVRPRGRRTSAGAAATAL